MLKVSVYASWRQRLYGELHDVSLRAESLDDGIAYVKVASPGVWMVRVEKRIETNARDFDLLSLKATLVFSVQ